MHLQTQLRRVSYRCGDADDAGSSPRGHCVFQCNELFVALRGHCAFQCYELLAVP